METAQRPTEIEWLSFSGADKEDITLFFQGVHRAALNQRRSRDDAWIADYVAGSVAGSAMQWFLTLDEETQHSWRKLKPALTARFSPAPPAGDIAATSRRSRAMLMTGVMIETIKPGDEKTYPQLGDVVTFHSISSVVGGPVFHNSRDTDARPFVTEVGSRGVMLRAVNEGLFHYSLGETAVMTCSPEHAYGAMGVPSVSPQAFPNRLPVPRNATVQFEIEVIKISSAFDR